MLRNLFAGLFVLGLSLGAVSNANAQNAAIRGAATYTTPSTASTIAVENVAPKGSAFDGPVTFAVTLTNPGQFNAFIDSATITGPTLTASPSVADPVLSQFVLDVSAATDLQKVNLYKAVFVCLSCLPYNPQVYGLTPSDTRVSRNRFGLYQYL
jgi:hypothetical protein